MFRVAVPLEEGMLLGFGLTGKDLDNLQFRQESIFFDFGYVGRPDLFGLIMYMDVETPEDIQRNLDAIRQRCIPFLDFSRGIDIDALRVFPFARKIVQEFRQTPFWGYTINMEISHPKDQQMFFAGKDEQDIKQFFAQLNQDIAQTL